MLKGKYVILNNGLPILLPSGMLHSDNFKEKDVSYAACWKIKDGTFICYGRSKSLNKEMGRNDANVLSSFFDIPDEF